MKRLKTLFLVILVNLFWVGSAQAQVGKADEFAAKMIGVYEVCKDIDDFTELKRFDREVAFLIAKFDVYQTSRLKKEVEKGRREVEKVLDFPVIHCGMALAFMVGTRAAVFAYESEVPPQDLSEFEAIVGEWMEVGGMFFSVDSLGQMCFKEYGLIFDCDYSNDSDFIFTALGNNRYQIEEDGDLVFLEVDGDLVKLREDGDEEASAIFVHFGSKELSELDQWVIDQVAEEKPNVLVEGLSPICFEQYRQDPNRLERLEALKKKNSYQRDDYVKEMGWATMPGAESPVRGVADACAKRILGLDGDIVKQREDGYEEASAIFARFGSEELSKLVDQWVIRALPRKKRVLIMVEVLARICVEQYRQDPNRLERFVEMKKKSSYQRDDYVRDIGWATMPGAESPVRGVADACAKQIIKLAG